MKDFTPYGLIIGIVVIVGIGIAHQYYLKIVSRSMVIDVQEAETIFLSGDLQSSSEKIQNVKEYWEKHEKILEVLVDHKEVNRIPEALIEIDNKIKNFFYCDNVSANFAVLKEYIKNMEEENLFTFSNIL